MTEPEIERFELMVKMEATITVYDQTGRPDAWLKPATSASCSWKGVPSEVELGLRYRDLTEATSATLEDVITNARTRLDQARRGG